MTDDSKPREFWIKDQLCVVDEEDWHFIKRFSWHLKKSRNTFYAITNVTVAGKDTSISMHRLILSLTNSEIDHKNRNGLDNRKSNLRACTKAENQRNRVRKNKFGFRGVYKSKRTPHYGVQIQVNGKKYHKKGFKTVEDAARAYDEMSKELHGEFGIRNFKD